MSLITSAQQRYRVGIIIMVDYSCLTRRVVTVYTSGETQEIPVTEGTTAMYQDTTAPQYNHIAGCSSIFL